MKIGGLRVDTQEVQGPYCKVAGINEFSDLIYNGKFRGPSPRCGGPRAAPVHAGPRTGLPWRLTGGWPKWCSVQAAHGCGEKRGEERSGEARVWCSPFIGAREGHAGARKGETASGNGPNTIEGGAA
jgi:hypothetical protein